MLIAHRRSTIRPERPSDIRVPPQPRCGRTLTPGSALLPTVIVYALVDARDDPATRSATRSTSTCAATTRSVISPGSSGTSRGGRRTSRCSRSNSSPAARTSRRGDPGSHPVGSRAAIRWVGSPQGRVSGVLVDDRWPSRPRYVLEVIQGSRITLDEGVVEGWEHPGEEPPTCLRRRQAEGGGCPRLVTRVNGLNRGFYAGSSAAGSPRRAGHRRRLVFAAHEGDDHKATLSSSRADRNPNGDGKSEAMPHVPSSSQGEHGQPDEPTGKQPTDPQVGREHPPVLKDRDVQPPADQGR